MSRSGSHAPGHTRRSAGNALARVLATLLLLSGLSACSWFDWLGGEDEQLKPAPLVDFDPDVDVDRVWSASVGNGQGKKYNRLVPALDGEMIFAAANNGQVAAFDAANGRRRWRTDLDAELSGGVGVGDGLVLVGRPSGEIVALDRDSGAERWQRQLGSEVLAAPAAEAGVVAAQTFNGTLYGLSAADGSELWRHESSLPVLTLRGTAAPVISDGEVFAAFANGKLVAIEASSGALLWEARLAAPQGQSEIERIVDIDGTPRLVGANLFAVSYQGRVGGFSRVAGRPLWMVDASSFERVAEGLGNIYVASSDGKVLAHDINTGLVSWQQEQLARRELSSPVAFRSWVAVADFEGYVHLLSQLDGHLSGRFRADSSGVRGEMVARDDLLYVYGNGGKLAAYRVRAK